MINFGRDDVVPNGPLTTFLWLGGYATRSDGRMYVGHDCVTLSEFNYLADAYIHNLKAAKRDAAKFYRLAKASRQR